MMATSDDVLADLQRWKRSAPPPGSDAAMVDEMKAWKAAEPKPVERSVPEEVGRQVGLTARAGIQGAGSLLGVGADPIAAVLNQVLPSGMEKFVDVRDLAVKLSDALGLPQPETGLERIVGAGAEGMAGAGAGVAAGSASVTRAAAPLVGQLLAQGPAAQILGGAGGGMAGQAAGEAGGGTAARLAASLAGGSAAGAIPSAAAMARAAKPAITQATKALQEGATAATQLLKDRGIIGSQPKPAAGTMGSVGAAATDMANQRVATAEALPQPIALTKGQATRDFEQQRFEAEAAKDPRLGQPLRERSMEQNRQLSANFESMIDATGAQATNAIETGRTVDRALVQAAAARKAEYRARYREAERAGQMEDPVSTAPIVQFLEENASANAPELAGGTLGIAQRELLRLGGAEMQGGRLVPRELPLRQVELLRRQVGNAIDAAPDNATNVRMGAQLKELIDQQTEGLGGDLYKEARASRRRYAQLFEDNAIVNNLLRTRRGTADRQVALEDVFRKTVLNGDRASLGRLRRTLQVAGGEQGAQAWRELQGATVRHLLEEATKGVGTDAAGVPLFSAAKLNNAVRALDADGKLEFVLSKQGAQTVRDLNEIAKVVLTTPPGTVNTSNTASVLLAALAESGATGALTGLPVPVLTGLKVLSQSVKDAKVRKRVNDALNQAKARQ